MAKRKLQAIKQRVNTCPKCQTKMTKQGEVDNHWKFYKCPKCGYELARV